VIQSVCVSNCRNIFDTCNHGIRCRRLNFLRLCKNVLCTTLPHNVRPYTLLTQYRGCAHVIWSPGRRQTRHETNSITLQVPIPASFTACADLPVLFIFDILPRDQQFQYALTAQSFQTSRSLNNSQRHCNHRRENTTFQLKRLISLCLGRLFRIVIVSVDRI
jgi:hypothetical protein